MEDQEVWEAFKALRSSSSHCRCAGVNAAPLERYIGKAFLDGVGQTDVLTKRWSSLSGR